jgi:hypothetical protein
VASGQAKYSGGTGEPNDPYQIATAADLIALGETPADYDKHFLLTADIDLAPNLPGRKVFDKAVIAPDTDLVKSDFQGTPFTGVFDGNRHTISHLTIKGGSYLGVFGQLASGAEVRNLGVVDVDTTGSGSYIGGLVGDNYQAHVTDCYSTGAVSGNSSVGGLVGCNAMTISNCYNTGSVTGRSSVGGLVGYHYSGHITCCYSTGVVSGGDSVGGLVGRNGELNFIGQRTGAGYVTFCYSTGEVSGTSYVGGLVGNYCRGPVTGCFWDIETSGQTTSAGGTGKTTAQMQDPNTFMAAGWDFVGQPDGPHDIWAEPEGGGYPILWWQQSPLPSLPRFSGGSGEPNDPYLISSAEELNSIGHNPRLMKCYFKLVSDLDLAGIRFYPVGDYDFAYCGVFDGNNHTISHVTIRGGSYLALFSALASDAEVKDLGVVDADITGSGEHIGALVGDNYGTVLQCYSTGTVSGKSFVGGLVGYNGGSITTSHSSGAVSGSSEVGGLVATNSGSVIQCYSTGAVSGTGQYVYVGGLVGWNYGTVTQCYSTGTVSGTGGSVGGLVGFIDSKATVLHCV